MRKRALGDVLWIEPVIRQLMPHYKKLIVHTKYNQLFENFPYKNVIFKPRLSFLEKCLVAAETKLNTRILSINLDNAYEKNPIHLLNAYQAKAGVPETKEYPKLYLSEKEKEYRYLAEPYVVLHIESLAESKIRHINGIDWAKVVSHLNDKGFKVLQVGLKDPSIEGAIRVKSSIRELISIINSAELFIGIDSGPSHIAASLGIKSLLLFGGIDPGLRHFPGVFNGSILKQQCESFGCKHVGNDPTDTTCTAMTDAGLPKCCVFKTTDVISKLEELLNKKC